MDDSGFIRAICENPADNTVRLACSDWLEDHGHDERAEFIRVQVERAQLAGQASAINRILWLEAREQELLDFGWSRWIHDVFDIVSPDVGVATSGLGVRFRVSLYDRRGGARVRLECTFRRGFIEHVELTLSDLMEHAAILFAAAPLTGVRLTDREPVCEASNVYSWLAMRDKWGSVAVVNRQRHFIPAPLSYCLRGQFLSGSDVPPPYVGQSHCYSDRAYALADLSRACVAYGRELAGLPPLDTLVSRPPLRTGS